MRMIVLGSLVALFFATWLKGYSAVYMVNFDYDYVTLNFALNYGTDIIANQSSQGAGISYTELCRWPCHRNSVIIQFGEKINLKPNAICKDIKMQKCSGKRVAKVTTGKSSFVT